MRASGVGIVLRHDLQEIGAAETYQMMSVDNVVGCFL